jgi:hypothetical protein
VGIGPLHGVAVAATVGGEPLGGYHPRRARLDQRDGDPVPVGVDPDDMVDQFCKHDEWNLPVSVSVGAGLDGTATPGL